MNDLYLQHHGVKGMKWGVRRYRRKDGSLTAAGKRRQAKEEYKVAKNAATNRHERAAAKQKYYNTPEVKAKHKAIHTAINVGGSVAAGYLLSSFGSKAYASITGDVGSAKYVGQALGVIGGYQYYQWLSK